MRGRLTGRSVKTVSEQDRIRLSQTCEQLLGAVVTDRTARPGRRPVRPAAQSTRDYRRPRHAPARASPDDTAQGHRAQDRAGHRPAHCRLARSGRTRAAAALGPWSFGIAQDVRRSDRRRLPDRPNARARPPEQPPGRSARRPRPLRPPERHHRQARPLPGRQTRRRRVLYLAALALVRSNKTPLAQTDRRLRDADPTSHAPAKAGIALVATMRKLLVTLNAMAKNNTPYGPRETQWLSTSGG